MRVAAVVVTISITASAAAAHAAGCSFAEQGTGHVTDVIDERTIRLSDDAEIRLAGLAPLRSTEATAALAARVVGRDVILRGDSDGPDRYGRQTAFIFLETDGPSLQAQLLAAGAALGSGTIADPACARELAGAEADGRRAKRGFGRCRVSSKTPQFRTIFWPSWGVSWWPKDALCLFARPGPRPI